MKKISDFDNVKEAGDNRSLPAGGYICSIWSIEDVPDKEYLKIEYDIVEGEWKNYGVEVTERAGFNPLRFVRSYKQSALGFFKRMISAIEKSNPGYHWDWDERTLIGKKFGAVLGEEQYQKNNGNIGTGIYLDREVTVDAIRHGDFKVPALKTLPGHEPTPADRSRLQPVQLSDKELEDLF